MANIQIGNRVIRTDLLTIIRRLRQESKYSYFKDIQEKSDYLRVTCPFHKAGNEMHPSMSIFMNADSTEHQPGNYNCLTCGEHGSLPKLVSYCLEISIEEAKEWLIERFSTELLVDDIMDIPDTDELDTILKPKPSQFLDSEILKQYEFYHPYMWKRKLSKEVVDRFNVGYDKKNNAITFPIFDEHHRLVMITERCVDSKKFYIDVDKMKPVYLLYDILDRNVDEVFICESQINALTLRTWGYDAVALIGTGSKSQYDILNSTGIFFYTLVFDGDEAGRKGARKFKNNVNGIDFTEVILPEGKDVNDVTQEEFEKLLKKAKENKKTT